MPLFSSKFSPRKASPRKSQSISNLHRDLSPKETQTNFGLDCETIKLKLGNCESTFKNGQWISENVTDGSSKPLAKLQKENKELHEKNNLLSLKLDIMLNMLTETTTDLQVLSKENEQLKSSISKLQKKLKKRSEDLT